MPRIDLSKWGPLTWLIVISVVVIEVFVGLYLIIARPSTGDVEAFIVAMGAVLGSPAILAVAHAILRGEELRADASSGVLDPAVEGERPRVTDEVEMSGVVRPESATTPDPVEGDDTDPNARLTTL